ncbi:hypothetical protein FQR65_LT11169 [Abscondita terminalis]|nr:hypothetical protein FQR65_LT11169 [Abscondita terminalis]
MSSYVVDAEKEEIMFKEVKEFKVRNSDIFLLGNHRSGTTWSQEMIWIIANDLNYEGAKLFVDERIPVIELSGYMLKRTPEVFNPECHWNSVEFVRKMTDPRCIKSHLPLKRLPEELINETNMAKIIYVARNPKDVCLSMYCYLNMVDKANCTFEEYCDLFMKGYKFLDNKYYDFWSTLLHFWNRRNSPNVLFIKYEDMKHDLATIIKQVATFLEKKLTEDEVAQLVKWLDFETMKNNEAVNHNNLYRKTGFMRTGKAGGHKEMMSKETLAKFDSWIQENVKNTDYKM